MFFSSFFFLFLLKKKKKGKFKLEFTSFFCLNVPFVWGGLRVRNVNSS